MHGNSNVNAKNDTNICIYRFKLFKDKLGVIYNKLDINCS